MEGDHMHTMNRVFRRPIIPAAMGLLGAFSASALASTQPEEERGLAIAREADRRDAGFGDTTAELAMHLRNRHGEESLRQLRIRILETPADGDKSLVIFDQPGDVKGTALLNFSHKAGPDDQWLFLPSLKRVKRIASDNKSGPFMGSEFAYEDLTSQEVEKYTYKYVRDEAIDGMPCHVIERVPVDPKSGYSRQIVWIDRLEFRAIKVDFFDRKAELMKTLTFRAYRQYAGRYWRAGEMRMVNHVTGKETLLVFRNYRFGNRLTDRDFDRASLERVR
jgi:hypothetical protein